MHSNKERDDVENNQFFCWVGTQVTQQTLQCYKMAISDEINLTGYAFGLKEEDAIQEACRQPVPGLVPVLLEISLDCDYNIVRLDRPEYTPYHAQDS